jgi:hypothetical protein
MTLYDLIMGGKGFTRSDWAALGRGELLDDDQISKMLMEGYQALVDED